jgi:hypothetical protein
MLKYAGIPLREGVLDDVRARMDARRNPAVTTTAAAQPAAPVEPAATQDTAPAVSAELPRATMSSAINKTTGQGIINYKGKAYYPSGPYAKAPEGATGTQVLVPAAAFGIRSMGDVVALLTDDGTAYAEQPMKVVNPFGRPATAAAPTAEPTKGLDEADDWEEETGKFQRFLEYAKKALMRERDPKRRIESANYLSKQENKFFGSPIRSAEEQTPFGSVSTGKAFTDLIKGIMDDIQSGNLHYEQEALAAAIWLEPEGKEFLKKAHNDFIQMIDHSSKEREQHAIALSGYQIANLGGKVIGDPLRGGVTNNPVARMTPEIYGVFELAEAELRRMKGEREDEAERQRDIAMWNALPGPLKLAAAAAVGKTPAQLEKILFAKNEIEAVGGLDVSDFPNLPQQAAADEFEKPEDKTPNNSADKKDKSVAESTELNTMLKYAGIPVSESRMLDEAGETLGHILNRFKHEVDQFEKGADLDNDLYYALFDYYSDAGEIPYGIAKGRDGDPYEWVTYQLDKELGVNEGWKGALAGGLAGGALGSVVPALGTLAGAAAGAYAGHKLGDEGFKDPDAEYKKAQKLKQTPPVDEADAISTFEVMSGFDAPVAEGSCNMTAEGQYCPEHGLMECGMAEGWKGELAGGTAGGVAGALAGTALAGPVGGLIGGAAGGTGGAMIGRELTKETGSYYESREGDAMLARIKSLALLK